mmetsp:Transcript_19477/g.61187  ORF Transcript_19477/g.61187 Transcript_19477/m.61187 type:complete len:323 (-) Transcript_19477:134-1102(-)
MDAAAQDYTVLGEPAEAAPPTGRGLRWRVALVASALSGVVLLAVAAAPRQPAHHVALAPLGPLPVAAPALRAAGALNASAAADLAAGYTRECWTYTGGTCNIWRCNAERGPTVCERVAAFFHYCKCQEGYCSDLAGRCIKQENSPVAVSVRFRNAWWPDYFMYVSGNFAMVDNGILDDTSLFNIYMLPSIHNRPNRLMMGSVRYPSFVCTTTMDRQCDDHNHGSHCVTSWPVGSERVSEMSLRHVIRMFYVDREEPEPAVMIEAVSYPGRFWYVPYGSWNVRARFGDPGPQGYWIPDPPLPDSLHLPQIAPIMVAANLTANL